MSMECSDAPSFEHAGIISNDPAEQYRKQHEFEFGRISSLELPRQPSEQQGEYPEDKADNHE
jgi:hypothetical protein